jgi:hypothetical protein
LVDVSDTRTTGRFRLIRTALIIVGSALIVVVGGSIAAGIVRTNVFGPQVSATAYLRALEQGDATTALRLGGDDAAQSRSALTTNAVFSKAANRIQDAEVKSVSVVGDTAAVGVHYLLAGHAEHETIKLTRTQTTWLIADKWSIVNASLPTVQLTVSKGMSTVPVTANGVNLRAFRPGIYSFSALPGAYSFAFGGNQYFEPASSTARVTSMTDSSATSDATISVSPTAAYKSQAVSAVMALVKTCAASTSMAVSHCPFEDVSHMAFGGVSGVSYSMTKEPNLSAVFENNVLRVVTTSPSDKGTVTDSYTDSFLGTPQPESYTQDFSISVPVTLHDGKITVGAFNPN